MKKAILVLLAIPILCYGAIQATTKYCDDNRDKAVSNAYANISKVLPDLVGPGVNQYMSENGIPKHITNIEERIVTTYTTNYDTFVVSVQKETNTVFEVGVDGKLRLYKGTELIWEEK